MAANERNLLAGAVWILTLGGILWLLLRVFPGDIAALMGSIIIWFTGMIYGVFCLLGEPGFQDRNSTSRPNDNPEELAHHIYTNYQPLLLAQFFLSSIWIGLTAQHWLIVGICYFAILFFTLRTAAVNRTYSPLWLLSTIVLLTSAMLAGVLVRLVLKIP